MHHVALHDASSDPVSESTRLQRTVALNIQHDDPPRGSRFLPFLPLLTLNLPLLSLNYMRRGSTPSSWTTGHVCYERVQAAPE